MDVFTFLVGGRAGEGVKTAGSAAARLFMMRRRYAFEMDDYQSLIRGGHNFTVVSTSTRRITSHYLQADLVVCLDKRSVTLHKDHKKENGILVYNSDVTEGEGIGIPFTSEAKDYPNPMLLLGVGAVAVLSAAIGQDRKAFETFVEQQYPRGIEYNRKYALKIYDIAHSVLGEKFLLDQGTAECGFLSGNQAIALGACAGGLDIYFAYPMTPASSILHYLAAHSKELGVTVIHPENEIAVINMAIGAAFTGVRTMVGSSGGGFALMQEAFSLAGMTETPLLCVLSSRPGPSTGVPTYTEQSDLRFAVNQGHGEFPRIVASPGSVEEAFHLAGKLLQLAWAFQTPAILLTDKHMSESSMTVNVDSEKAGWVQPRMHESGVYDRYRDTPDGISPLLFVPSDELIKWNSYEHDEKGITTEDAQMIEKMHNKRQRKGETLIKHLKGTDTVNVYGNGDPLIFTYGSTTMSVLEAVEAGPIHATVVQPVFLEPFPVWELEQYKNRRIITVEMSCTGQFASLLKEKAAIVSEIVIRKYDGRPFDPLDLADSLKEVF